MTKNEFDDVLRQFLRQDPFEPFVVEFEDGRQWTFEKPSLVVNNGGAGFIGDDGGIVDFTSDEVAQIVQLAGRDFAR